MVRKIVKIDQEKCNGCGLCISACHEGAIGIVNGKAELLRDDYCDGLGNCLPVCPTEAICIEEREAPEYNETELRQWPVQIKLVSVNASYFRSAELLISADCSAYAYGNFHNDFMHDKITLIGCPKLDGLDYSDKLTAIFVNNEIASVTVVRMEVPCCGGIEHAIRTALEKCKRPIPFKVITITTDGRIL